MGKTKVKTREQLEDRVQDLREQLLSNKRGVMDAIEQRHKYQMEAREDRNEALHAAWEKEAGGRPRKSYSKSEPYMWVNIDEDTWRYTRDYATRIDRYNEYAEAQLAKIAEATKMVELTKTMLAANETRLQAKDFWYDLFWPVTIWLACRSRPRASQPR